jgi:thiol:disulfide interchange protein DsbD
MQHPAVPIVVAGVLVVLALSLFGLFEIPVPSFISSRSQARSGALGALAMGLIFGLVAAPCVGPAVVALLIVVGQMGDPVKGFLMFFTLSLGLGTPFFFLALFSGALARIPKPGTWMMAVRKVFGFLLLGAAIYYVKQLLPAPLAGMIIPLFLIAAGLYWAVFEVSTRGMRVLRPVQQILGIAVVTFGAWTLFAPVAQPMQWTPYSEKAVVASKDAGKPVIIDFTAKWCKPCEELDRKTFSNAAVRAEADRFTRLSADITKKSGVSDRAVKYYKVAGPPTIILLDSKGEEKGRIIGYINAGNFLNKLKQIK